MKWCSYKAKSRTLSDNNSQMSYRFQPSPDKMSDKNQMVRLWASLVDILNRFDVSFFYKKG